MAIKTRFIQGDATCFDCDILVAKQNGAIWEQLKSFVSTEIVLNDCGSRVSVFKLNHKHVKYLMCIKYNANRKKLLPFTANNDWPHALSIASLLENSISCLRDFIRCSRRTFSTISITSLSCHNPKIMAAVISYACHSIDKWSNYYVEEERKGTQMWHLCYKERYRHNFQLNVYDLHEPHIIEKLYNSNFNLSKELWGC